MSRCPTIAISLALLAAGALAQSQASGLKLEHRSGQTFLLWKEVTAAPVPDAYHVYRAATPIQASADLDKATLVARVPKGSSVNGRAARPFVLKDLGPSLAADDGVLVTTPTASGSSYYAVVAVTNNVENRSLSSAPAGNSGGPVVEVVAAPQPILQSVTNGDYHFVHFLPAALTSAGPALTNREGRAANYRVIVDQMQPSPRPVFVILHARGSSYLVSTAGWTPPNAVQVILDDDNPPMMHSVWFGHHQDYGVGSPVAPVSDFTERRILWTLQQVLQDSRFQCDANRIYAFGVSFGAMGAFALGLRHADVFAASAGVVPAFDLRHSDFSLINEAESLFGTVAQNLTSSLGPRVYDLFDYATAVQDRVSPGVAPMFFTVGRADTVTGWTEKPRFIRAAQSARQPLALYWDYRAHSTTGPWSVFEPRLFTELSEIRLDRPLPAFSNLSLDDDPGNGDRFQGDLIGTIAGYATFDPTTATETASKVSLDIALKSDASRLDYAISQYAKADVTWRRLRQFPVKAGSYYRVRTRSRGQVPVLEERVLVPDGDGLLTVRRLELERAMRTSELEPYAATLPETHLGGAARPGGTLAISLLAPGNQFAMLTIGGTEGQIPTPFGVWRILDPIFLWGGVTPASGQLELIVDIPDDPRLHNLALLAQAMVGLQLTNLAKITFQ